MLSEIIYECHGDYLQIKYPKYNNINEFFDSIDNAFKICKEKNYNKLILDIFDINFTEIRVIDKFLAGEKIAELFKSSNKVAVLAPKKFHDNFTEVVAANRGSLLKAFDEKKDAVKWIRQ